MHTYTMVVIQGHRFHHEKVIDALDMHAAESHVHAANAVAADDGHVSSANVGYTDV